MTLFLIGYALAGTALYKPSREGSDAARFGYFLVFPFHTVAVPLVIALGNGTRDLLNNKGFWVLLLVGLTAFFATDAELRIDPVDAFVCALMCVGILKALHYAIKEMFGI